MIGNTRNVLQEMGRKHNPTVRRQLPNQIMEMPPLQGVEAGAGLVQNEPHWVTGECSREAQTSLHSSRKLATPRITTIPQINPVEPIVRPVVGRLNSGTFQPGGIAHRLNDPHGAGKQQRLREPPEFRQVSARTGHPTKADLPLIKIQVATAHATEGRLSCPIAPQESRDAGSNSKIDIIEGLACAECQTAAFDFQPVHFMTQTQRTIALCPPRFVVKPRTSRE